MSQPGMPPQQPGPGQYPGQYPTYGPPPGQGFPPPTAYPGQQQHRAQPAPEVQRDVEAAWQARLELGPEYEQHIAAGLAERVEELARQRSLELSGQTDSQLQARKHEESGSNRQLVLGIVSVVMGVPITAIAGPGMEEGVLPVIVAWTGIGVNVAHALGLRHTRRRHD